MCVIQCWKQGSLKYETAMDELWRLWGQAGGLNNMSYDARAFIRRWWNHFVVNG